MVGTPVKRYLFLLVLLGMLGMTRGEGERQKTASVYSIYHGYNPNARHSNRPYQLMRRLFSKGAREGPSFLSETLVPNGNRSSCMRYSMKFWGVVVDRK